MLPSAGRFVNVCHSFVYAVRSVFRIGFLRGSASFVYLSVSATSPSHVRAHNITLGVSCFSRWKRIPCSVWMYMFVSDAAKGINTNRELFLA